TANPAETRLRVGCRQQSEECNRQRGAQANLHDVVSRPASCQPKLTANGNWEHPVPGRQSACRLAFAQVILDWRPQWMKPRLSTASDLSATGSRLNDAQLRPDGQFGPCRARY